MHRGHRSAFTKVQAAFVLAVAALASGYTLTQPSRGARTALVVSTTTSLFDTGILDAIEDAFEAKHGVDIYYISVGTGIAIQQAERGDADLLLVHAPSVERRFLENGHGVVRKIVAYNFFALVGPKSDPAGIRSSSPKEALSKIGETGERGEALWVSRGDNSGTHEKEKVLWASAGVNLSKLVDEPWYLTSGTGMGNTLSIANEKGAYTLADMGTYLKYVRAGLVRLDVLVGEGRELLNVYSAMAINPDRHSKANFEGALDLIRYLVSDEGQRAIGEYGRKEYGRPLFLPAASLLRDRSDPSLVSWMEELAYFEGSECPPRYRHGIEELYPQGIMK